MASFDIVNKVDAQLLDNAINVARKEIINRFDFNGSKTEITLDKKDMSVHITTENEMRVNSITDVIRQRMIKQQLNPLCLDFEKDHYASGVMVKKDIKVKEGIDKDVARKIIKDIKDSKLKVQAQMMDDQVRVTAKKIDDLQAVIALMRQGSYDLPLQFVNMKG
ncbi:MAG: YajQ family cyclic di-GMP-binding protein [Bacteroidetes bacterium]|nr:YajQ family cyclic di-GMP-binding protein [Bacteroidota bacterium]